MATGQTNTNVLHQYASSTYRITWYLLSNQDHADLCDNPDTFRPRHVLMSSGGGYPNPVSLNAARHPDFQEDFFINDLRMTTIVGLNSKAKASNAISVSFNVIEPYGLTLLDRLLSACGSDPINCPNYLEQPYLLEIDFLGNAGDLADPDNPDSTREFLIDRKRIAIRLISFAIKPDVGGTVYKIDAVPFNHMALTDSVASCPVNLSVEASTVGDFFGDESADEVASITDSSENRAESEFNKWKKDQPFGGAGLSEDALKSARARFGVIQRTNSFSAAYNNHFKQISGPEDEYQFKFPPNIVKFIVDEKFSSKKIVDALVTETRATPMDAVDERASKSWTNAPSIKNAKTVQIFQVNAGTNIVSIIDRVMTSSEYITDQLHDFKAFMASFGNSASEQQARNNALNSGAFKFLDWYKIIPQVKVQDFDVNTQAYSKLIEYHIVPYRVANQKHPDFAKAKISKSNIARTYNYLYTGDNSDILDVNIDFDAAYFTSITSYESRKSESGGSSQSKRDGGTSNLRKLDDNRRTDKVKRIAQNPPNVIRPIGSRQQRYGQLNKVDDPTSITVSDLVSSLYTEARGDMLNIDLKIIGDPAFIKQDDVYLNPSSKLYKATQARADDASVVTNDNGTSQVLFDMSEIYVQLTFNTVNDLDDETGIFDPNKKLQLQIGEVNSTFSGAYRVISVDSNFSDGQFTQNLFLIRVLDNAFDSANDQPAPPAFTQNFGTTGSPGVSSPFKLV